MRKHRRIKTQHLTRIHWHRFLITSIVLFCLVFLITLYWFIFLSNFFQIQHIEIRGLDNVQKIEQDINNYFLKKNQRFVPILVEKILNSYFNMKLDYKNMLFVSNKELADLLMSKYPEFSLVTSKLDIQNSNLIINIIPREISYLVCRKENDCYFMDNKGVLFREAPQTSGSLIKTIFIKDFTPMLGELLFQSQDLDTLNQIFLAASEENSPLNIKFIELEHPRASTLKIVSYDNWYLLLNFNSDVDNVFKIVQGLFSGELKGKERQLEYIDCRFLPRVYYLIK